MEKINNIKKALTAFQKLNELNQENAKDLLESNNKVFLEIMFKRMPSNHEPFCEVIGPLPHPTNNPSELTTCFIVRDINRSKYKVKDRELDLKQTKDHYKELLEASGVPSLILKNMFIMPVRELITEYDSHQAKNKLAAAFDIFLVDATLINNKYKYLRRFLGSAFTDRSKKCPIPVQMKEPEQLKLNVMKAIRSTNLYVAPYAQTSSVLVGRTNFDTLSLGKNIKYVVNKLTTKYDGLVGTLKLCDNRMQGITFFADLRKLSVQSFNEKFPVRLNQKRERVKISRQFKEVDLEEEMSDTEKETLDGKYEIKHKKLRYEDISIF